MTEPLDSVPFKPDIFQVAQAELVDVNLAFHAYVATDDEEDADDSVVSVKDNYHIGENSKCDLDSDWL